MDLLERPRSSPVFIAEETHRWRSNDGLGGGGGSSLGCLAMHLVADLHVLSLKHGRQFACGWGGGWWQETGNFLTKWRCSHRGPPAGGAGESRRYIRRRAPARGSSDGTCGASLGFGVTQWVLSKHSVRNPQKCSTETGLNRARGGVLKLCVSGSLLHRVRLISYI